ERDDRVPLATLRVHRVGSAIGDLDRADAGRATSARDGKAREVARVVPDHDRLTFRDQAREPQRLLVEVASVVGEQATVLTAGSQNVDMLALEPDLDALQQHHALTRGVWIARDALLRLRNCRVVGDEGDVVAALAVPGSNLLRIPARASIVRRGG